MDGYANFGLLRERLGAGSNKTALAHLELVRVYALEEFRELTKLGKTITLDGVTYDDVKRHSMSVEVKERVVFSLGWECVKESNLVMRDNFLNTDITLHHLNILPHCALLHVLAMIENVTDGDGVPQIIPMRYNFCLLDDSSGVFRGLIAKIPMFYPEFPIGKVEAVEGKAEPAVGETNADESLAIEKLLTAQLLARYHFLDDNHSLDEFHRRMDVCGISKEKAKAFMDSDIEIISRLDKRFLTEPGFMNTWFITIDEAKLKEDQKEYLTDREFTVSEISKIFDEINWHNANSVEAPRKLMAWRQIRRFTASGEEPILNVAVTMLTLLGWSLEEAHRYLFNEKLLIDQVRWGYKTAQVPFTPGVNHPQSEAFKKQKSPDGIDLTLVSSSTPNPVPNSEGTPGAIPVTPVKQKVQGKRLVYFILTIFFGFCIYGMTYAPFENIDGLTGALMFAPLFILFLWLYRRKGKEQRIDYVGDIPDSAISQSKQNETQTDEKPTDTTFYATYYLTSQLLARYHFLNDNQSLKEFYRRMDICGITKDKADALMKSELDIIVKHDKRHLVEYGFIASRVFSLAEKVFNKKAEYYIKHQMFTTSELINIVDEACWHYNHSIEKTLSEDAWNEILDYSSNDEGELFLNAPVEALKKNGWLDEEANRYISKEVHILAAVKWQYYIRHPYQPNEELTEMTKINERQEEPPKVKQTVVSDTLDSQPKDKPTLLVDVALNSEKATESTQWTLSDEVAEVEREKTNRRLFQSIQDKKSIGKIRAYDYMDSRIYGYGSIIVHNLLTSQLLARYHYLDDERSYKQFQTRMEFCKISKEKSDALLKSELEIMERLDKRFLAEEEYILSWCFPFDKVAFDKDIDYYIDNSLFTTSESMKIFDEACWHVFDSNGNELADDVWNEVWNYSKNGHGKTLPSALERLCGLGWSEDEAHRYMKSENELLRFIKWGYGGAENPYPENPENLVYLTEAQRKVINENRNNDRSEDSI